MALANLDNLNTKETAAIKAAIVHLDSKYGSKGEVTKVSLKKGTYLGAGKVRNFTLTEGARPGTFSVKIAGQTAVTKPVPAKAAKPAKATAAVK